MSKVKQLLAIILITAGILTFTGTGQAQAQLGDTVLKEGSRGSDVLQLQNSLQYLGYQVGAIDGIFGPQTLKAVKSFQSNHGLNIDGIVGAKTVEAILKQTNTQPSRSAQPSRGYISSSSQDVKCLAQLIYGEARGECFEGQVAVAAVVLNRLHSGKFGNSIRSVIFEPGAFTAISDGQFYLQPNETAYRAAQAALNGWDPTGNALYYWNPKTATNKWVWSRSIIKTIGNHVFAK